METQIMLGFQGIPYGGDDFCTAQILSSIIGGGMSSRLFQEVREKRGLCYSIYAFHWSFADTGVFGVHAATGPEDVNELMPVIVDELERADRIDHRQAKSSSARAQLRAGLLMTLESPAARAGAARAAAPPVRPHHSAGRAGRADRGDRQPSHVRDLAGGIFSGSADACQRRPPVNGMMAATASPPASAPGSTDGRRRRSCGRSPAQSPTPPSAPSGCLLRAPILADYPQWAKLAKTAAPSWRRGSRVWPADDLTKLAFRRRIRRYQREIRNGTGYPFFVFSPDGETLLGGLTLEPHPARRRAVRRARLLDGLALCGQGLHGRRGPGGHRIRLRHAAPQPHRGAPACPTTHPRSASSKRSDFAAKATPGSTSASTGAGRITSSMASSGTILATDGRAEALFRSTYATIEIGESLRPRRLGCRMCV